MITYRLSNSLEPGSIFRSKLLAKHISRRQNVVSSNERVNGYQNTVLCDRDF